MSPNIGDLSRMLSAAGVGRIKLASGVVPQTTYAAGVAFIAMLGAAYCLSANTLLALVVIGAIFLGLVIYLFGTWSFAHKHPDLALLGGAELIQWRAMDMAKQGGPIPLSGNTSPPTIDHNGLISDEGPSPP